jgi:dihydroflavonol-4-reductase
MKVFLTGITGFLGGHVATELLRRNYQLKALVREGADVGHLRHLPIEWVRGSLSDLQLLEEAMQGCEEVIHAASSTQMWPQRFEDFEAVNVTGTINLCTAALKNKVSRFVYVSTANTLGYGSAKQPGTELNLFNLYHIGSGYINSKFLAQQYVLEQVERKGLPALVVNPTFLIGPRGHRPGSGKTISDFFSEYFIFYPPGISNFLDVRDAATAIVNALHKGTLGECYLLAGQNLSYKQFFQQLREYQIRKAWLFPLGKGILYGVAYLVELLKWLTGRHFALNLPNARMLCLKGFYDSGSKARRELSLPCTPLLQTLADAVAWTQGNHHRKKKQEWEPALFPQPAEAVS